MIQYNEIKNILEQDLFDKVICRNFEMKPKNLAYFIAQLSNLECEYGYILNGVEKTNNHYNINGIDKELDISEPLKSALSMLDIIPKTEIGNFELDNKNVLVIKVYKIKKTVNIVVKSEISETIDKYLEDVLYSCIQLQSLAIYCTAKEDERNDFITKILESKGYRVKDQTRRGKSNSGKGAGEVDMFISTDKGFPFSIIEALNLKSLDTSYLDTHINKINNYDTVGNQINICLSYVSVVDFESFWLNYCKHIKNRTYNNSLIAFDEVVDNDFPYSEIRYVKTTHNRSGKLTYLYHIAVAIK